MQDSSAITITSKKKKGKQTKPILLHCDKIKTKPRNFVVVRPAYLSYVGTGGKRQFCYGSKPKWQVCASSDIIECVHIHSNLHIIRPVTSLGHQDGRRVFREGQQFFELSPIFLNCVQHIFPGGAKNFLVGGFAPPLVMGLHIMLKILPLL